MTSLSSQAALTALATYLPDGQLTNEMLEREFPNWPASKILAKTGIASRHIAAPDEFASEMGAAAAKRIFAEDAQARDGIDFVIFVTVTPDYLVPCTASRVHDLLELPKTVGSIDLVQGCSGFPYGLSMASALVESGRARKVLLITATRLSTFTEEASHGTKTLFGDAAAACLVESFDGQPGRAVVRASSFGTDGSGGRDIIVPTSGVRGFAGVEASDTTKPIVEMNGPKVFEFALRVVPGHIREFLQQSELTTEDVDLFVFHQANEFMLEHLRRRLKIPKEKFAVRTSDVGNTVESSIPLALEPILRDRGIPAGGRVLLVAFGTGYSWASVLLEYSK